MSSYRLYSLCARTTLSDRDSAGNAVMHHRWGFAAAVSLGIGANLIIQALLAGAPIAESLLGGTVVAVGVCLSYAITQRESFPRAVAVRQRLRLLAVRRTLKGTAAAAGLLLLGVSFAPDAQARTRCSYAGPPTNVLTVTLSRDSLGVIKRRGLEITASEFLEAAQALLRRHPDGAQHGFHQRAGSGRRIRRPAARRWSVRPGSNPGDRGSFRDRDPVQRSGLPREHHWHPRWRRVPLGPGRSSRGSKPQPPQCRRQGCRCHL